MCTVTDPTKKLPSESLSAKLMLDGKYNSLGAGQFLQIPCIFVFFLLAPKEFDEEMSTEDFYAYLNGQGMSLGDCNKISGNN